MGLPQRFIHESSQSFLANGGEVGQSFSHAGNEPPGQSGFGPGGGDGAGAGGGGGDGGGGDGDGGDGDGGDGGGGGDPQVLWP